MSKAFWIIAILIVVIGLAVWGWVYLQKQEIGIRPTPTVRPVAPVTTESQLKDVETDLKEEETIESEMNTEEIETLEKDLEPSQFDVL